MCYQHRMFQEDKPYLPSYHQTYHQTKIFCHHRIIEPEKFSLRPQFYITSSKRKYLVKYNKILVTFHWSQQKYLHLSSRVVISELASRRKAWKCLWARFVKTSTGSPDFCFLYFISIESSLLNLLEFAGAWNLVEAGLVSFLIELG